MSRVVDEVVGRHWPGQVLQVRPLPGGITNSNFLVDLAGRSLVFRVPGKDTDLLGIERRSEVLAQGLAAVAGVAAALILVDPPTGCLVSGFVHGRQVPPPELAAEPMLGHLADTIRTVQHCGRVPAVFDPLAVIRRYHRCAEQRGVAEPFDYAGQLAVVERFRARRAFSPTVLGHNDLLAGNIIYDGSLKLIDWEYAGMTDPYFDLANVSATTTSPQGATRPC
jgi:aminoglycoside phosphotransferase (APT) family kinase protein